MKKIPVFVIDGQTLFCDALAGYLKASSKFEMVQCFTGGLEFIDYLSAENYDKRAVAVMDISLPGMNGVEIHNRIQVKYPQIRTVFLSSFFNGAVVKQLMNKHAGSFMVKNCHLEDLTETIEQVYYFNHYMSDSVLKALDWLSRYPDTLEDFTEPGKLSKRETEVLRLICLQLNSHEIAEKLFLSLRTVESHRNTLLYKTGAHNTAGLVSFAVKNDLYFPA